MGFLDNAGVGRLWGKVKALVDGVKVGGRNYILDSANLSVSSLGSSAGSRGEYRTMDVGNSYMNIPDGTQVTISFDLEMEVNTENARLLVYNQNQKSPKTFEGKYLYFDEQPGETIKKRCSLVTYVRDRENATLNDNYVEFYSVYGTSNWFRISNLKMEIGNKDTDWTPAPEDIVDSIQIGGRNLLCGSEIGDISLPLFDGSNAVLSGLPYLDGAPLYSMSGPAYIKVNFPILNTGDVYTFSCDVARQSGGSAKSVIFTVNGENINVGTAVGGTWTNFSVTFTAKADSTNILIRVGSTDVSDTGWLGHARHFKLEKGNKDTDWTPAPEDKADADHTHTWDVITSKPTTFPPSTHTHDTFIGATATPATPGVAGMVPAPDYGQVEYFLRGDGTWALPPTTDPPSNIDGNAGTATKLQTTRYIDGVGFNGSANISHYATCSTSGSAAAKTCSITGFSLVTGARVIVRFSYANTAANPTLDVSSTGAKAIYYKGSAIPSNYIKQYTVLELVYDGSYWYVVGDLTQYLVDTLVSPTVLYTSTTGIYASATQTWAYTTVSGLSTWKEVRLWVEVGDATCGYVTVNTTKSTAYVNGYYSTAYNGAMRVIADFANNRVGVYVTGVTGWAYSNLRVLRVEGLVKA